MFQFAVLCFVATLAASFAGFGGTLGMAVALMKGLAVVFLLLFVGAAWRGLYSA